MSRILLMLAHSIEEWHQVALMHQLGHEVFSVGAYINPAIPGDDKRPALPDVPFHEDLAKVVWGTPSPTGDSLWAAKDRLPDELLDWADVVICHHVEWRWLLGNWPRLKASGKRVIWRTVGQSTHENEARMAPLRSEGLQIVRYSPKERAIPYFAGEDALIRFWVDLDELQGWSGTMPFVGNVTQDLAGRGEWTGYSFWDQATHGLRAYPAGPKSEEINGLGALSYDDLKAYLQGIRAYLYLGTFPASYTLGMLEAMATGVPLVAASPDRWRTTFSAMPYGHLLYEAHELAPLVAKDPDEANGLLRMLLADKGYAADISAKSRASAKAHFDRQMIAQQWADFLR